MSRPVWVKRAFSPLAIRNFRLYFIGQTLSMSGTWMQRVAQSWLVLELTGSGTALGLVTAVQFLPMLILAPYGGVIADRFNKQRLLLITQSAAAILACALGLLVVFDVIRLWMVYVLAGALGLVSSVDNPTRQTFVPELVGREKLTSAVSLNSVLVNLARVLGPAAAGVLIVTVGLGPCFLVNSGTYLAVIVALILMRADELQTVAPQPRRAGQLREGLRYVGATPAVLTPLLMMGVVGMFAYEFQVILPLIAKFTFGGDAGTYATMSACMGGGAVVGGLVAASRRTRPAVALSRTAAVFGVTQLITSFAPNLVTVYVALVALGAASITFLALGNATLQLSATPEMRGRVMGLWAVAFLGSTPIGGPIIGWVGENVGPRYGLGLGGVATLLAAAFAYRKLLTIGPTVIQVAGTPALNAKLGP
ncbi:MAG: MFS transporter [Acidimicrobiia bacterium]|nr:MFS transporter [Acidimicrobiia bacterium]